MTKTPSEEGQQGLRALNEITETLRVAEQEQQLVREQFADLCWQVYRQGASQQAIADATGYSRGRIGHLLRDYKRKNLGMNP